MLILESVQGKIWREWKFTERGMKARKQRIWGVCAEHCGKIQAEVGICEVKERRGMYFLAILRK